MLIKELTLDKIKNYLVPVVAFITTLVIAIMGHGVVAIVLLTAAWLGWEYVYKQSLEDTLPLGQQT